MEIKGINIEQPIFVIGIGRSGTTLLTTMLNAHSNICFPPEAMLLKHYVCRPRIHKIFIQHKRKFFNLLDKDSSFNSLGMKAKRIMRNKNNFGLKEYYQAMLTKYAKSKNKSLVGDTYPRNMEILPEIRYLFPNAYIIHIIRDPRDIIASKLKTWWGQRRSLISHIGITREILSLAVEQGHKLFDQNYYELRYEDLLSNPKKKLHEICKVIGVDYEENMLNFQRSASEIIQTYEMNFKSYNLKPLVRNNTQKWKKDLNRFSVVLIESGCGTNMKNYNYQLNYNLLSIFFRPLNIIYFLFGRWFRIYQEIRLKRLLTFSSFSNG